MREGGRPCFILSVRSAMHPALLLTLAATACSWRYAPAVPHLKSDELARVELTELRIGAGRFEVDLAIEADNGVSIAAARYGKPGSTPCHGILADKITIFGRTVREATDIRGEHTLTIAFPDGIVWPGSLSYIDLSLARDGHPDCLRIMMVDGSKPVVWEPSRDWVASAGLGLSFATNGTARYAGATQAVVGLGRWVGPKARLRAELGVGGGACRGCPFDSARQLLLFSPGLAGEYDLAQLGQVLLTGSLAYQLHGGLALGASGPGGALAHGPRLGFDLSITPPAMEPIGFGGGARVMRLGLQLHLSLWVPTNGDAPFPVLGFGLAGHLPVF